MSTQLLDRPTSMDESTDEGLFLLSHPSGKYGCFVHPQTRVHGLAVFSAEGYAGRFAEWVELSGMKIEKTTIEEASSTAAQRPPPVECVMLCDSLNNPEILTWVK